MKALIYDTETTGMPLFDQPSDDPRQPRIIQIAAALIDTETRADLAAINLTIHPDDWTIPPEVQAIHSISVVHCAETGIPISVALSAFIGLWQQADVRIGHVESFDARMVRIELKRHPVLRELADHWKDAPAICTKAIAKKHIPDLPAAGGGSLKAVHRYYLGEDFDSAHTAEADMRATARVWFAMQERGHV